MAEYHMMGDSMYGVGGMEENPNMVNAGGYGHNAQMNVGGPGMMSQGMGMNPVQNPGAMMQGMQHSMQQPQAQQQQQPASQMSHSSIGSYHQGPMHGYSQNEVPQKLHQYAGYGSPMPSGNAGSQYMSSGPRLHHMSDSLAPTASPQQQQPRAMVPNQMAYQNRSMGGSHYGQQQMVHPNAASSQMPQQNPARYPSQYASIQHHQYQQQQQQQHSMQQMSQNTDMWQGSMNHSQMTPRQCMPQNYPTQSHQAMSSQHGNSTMTHSPLTMQGQRPSTPNQSQYVNNQEYSMQQQHPSAAQVQRSQAYSLNSSTINQNGTHMGQSGPTPQASMPQAYNSLTQNESGMYPQGHYASPSQASPARPHYNPSSTSGSAVPQSAQQPQQQHLVGQQPVMGMRPSMHQMGYSSVPSRVNATQQHSGTLPPGSPARVQQYHPPFSPNQGYPTTAQPSPRSVAGETATPPHMPHYSQNVTMSPTSPQYRNQFPPSQLTQSPQHLAATPPAEASAPTSSCTPDRSRHSTPVPQSQGSFPSPSTTHMTSPGHGQSPGNTSAPPSSSLQHLEQMVMPHVGSGSSTPSNIAVSSVGPSSATLSHNSGSSGYYSHIHASAQDSQQQHLMQHMSSASEPLPSSPALSHVATSQPHPHHNFAAHNITQQTAAAVGPIQGPAMDNVPNTQSLPPATPNTMAVHPKSIVSVEDTNSMESEDRNSMVSFASASASVSSLPSTVSSDSSMQPDITTQVPSHITVQATSQAPPPPQTATHVSPLSQSQVTPQSQPHVTSQTQSHPPQPTQSHVSPQTHMPQQTQPHGQVQASVPSQTQSHVPQQAQSHVPSQVQPHVPPPVQPHVPLLVQPHVPLLVQPHVPLLVQPHVPLLVQPHVPPQVQPLVPPQVQPLVPPPQVQPLVTPQVQPHMPPQAPHVPVQAVTSIPSNHLGPITTANPESLSCPPHQHSMGPYQASAGPVNYEIQQIQQQLQKLHAMNSNGESQDEINNLQERLVYLQSQSMDSSHVPNSVGMNIGSSNNTLPAQYPRSSMMYGPGNQMPYPHQSPMQPHGIHYGPQQSPMINHEHSMPVLGPPTGHLMNDIYQPGNSMDMDAMDATSQHGYGPLGEPPPMPVMPPSGPPIDPYELNFNDEPPKKMKRRPPKEPKEPKPPKEKKPPKPKKPKKPKGESMVYFPENFIGPLPEHALRMEKLEPGAPPPPLNEDGSITPQEKKKKNRKRKAKEKENDEPSSETKEPKPKKAKKPKSPKKRSKEAAKAEAAEQAVNELGEPIEGTIEGDENGEVAEAGGDEKKEKKDSKSPKGAGSGKESKKSTPKKKLPKLALRFPNKKKKKKKKSIGSPDNSDMEKTPPPSPEEGEGVQKRRSTRNTSRKKYTDDIDLHLTDDETIEMELGQAGIFNQEGKLVQVVLDNHSEDHMVVEKILAVRQGSKQGDSKATDNDNADSLDESNQEYYVKYKNLSYIHCEWKTTEELEMGDRRFLQKVKRFKQKKADFNFFDFLDDEPFNPDYIEVDRVLDVNEIFEPRTDDVIYSKEEVARELFPDDEKNRNSKDPVKDSEDTVKDSEDTVKDSEDTVKDSEDTVKDSEDTVKDSDVNKDLEGTIKDSEDVNKDLEDVNKDLEDVNKDLEDVNKDLEDSNKDSEDAIRDSGDTIKDSGDTIKDSGGAKPADVENQNVPETKDGSESAVAEKDTDKVEPMDTSEVDTEANIELKSESKEHSDKNDEATGEVKVIATADVEKKEGKVVRHYLVKWRALTYEESTWELEEDVDRNKIEIFERFRYPPPKEKWKVKKRPIPSKWAKIEDCPVYKGGNNLREYQLEGVNWLTFCWYNGQNCILADEMGLGKTIQSIAYLHEIDLYGIPGPFLVIAPLSTIGNWQREFETWTDLNTITYHGSSPSRNMIVDYEMYWKDENGERIQEVYKFQVLITTFEIILTDCQELKAIPWRCVIIDEAHRLKNRNCKLLEGLRMLNTEHRVLLTGTPLQNNVEELFSLLNFLEPNRFASTEAFLEEFGDLKTEAQVDKLKALLKPMMLRRLKEDVEKSLAPKEETVVEVELTNIQKKYYRAILERNFTFLTKGNCYSNIPNLMNTMMELRKCCIHPFLINGAEEQINLDYRSQHEETPDGHLNAMVQASGKLVLMDKLLPRLKENGHRVLVFSQMVRCLDILEDYMIQKRYPFERIDGRVRGNLRQAAIDRYCKPDSDRFVFLLCTRAGGLGINLTAADTVIIFDSDWNPQNDLQAQARCHRIGQSKSVKVYRLICRNTYEREMFDKASLKLGLDKAVLQSMCPSKENPAMNQQMSKKEIEDLLRKGAYGALMEDDNAGDKFCEEDIDQILQRRTQVIHLESGTQGSTFSKATFASASTRSDIEIDDPNFWEKWAKKANLDVDELKTRNELIIQEPRRRTQTRRFGTDDQMVDLSELETSDEDDESVSTRTRASRRSSKFSGKRPKNRGRALDRERDDEYMEEIAPGNWTRAECFKVEKGLLTFGWGRWDEFIALGQFRRRVTHKDCEHISRTILLYCLLHYKGDEKIKSFIWDLICPTYEGEQPVYRNHSEAEIIESDGQSGDDKGLSAPVPRGRKGKKIKKEIKAVDAVIEESEWAKEEKHNPDILLNDEAYRKHLNRHANKVLLRVRLLYYLKHEIIGDLHDQVFSCIPASLIPLDVPPADGEAPAPWWDREVDKSLLLGIYKHGFERYNLMRQDPSLIFLSRCGPPDGAALLAELKCNDEDLAEQASQEEAADKEGKFTYDKEIDDLEPMSPASESQSSKNSNTPVYCSPEKYAAMMMGVPLFPSVTDVNTRVRRLITAYQRNNKKLEIRNAQKAKKIERREKFEAAIREREMKKRELQQRKWSRREEADFYRTISAFGVEFTEDKKGYNWSRFRNLARLERKYDDTLAEYYKSFYAMCKRVCGRKLTEEEEQLSFVVDPISEERASRCLQRVDLLHKIREEILVHPELDERLKLCQPSMDLPDWWQCGKHDKDLLIGAAKHGLSRMDYHLLHDADLSFREVLKNHPPVKPVNIGSHVSTPVGCSSPVTTGLAADAPLVKEELMSDSAKDEVKVSLQKDTIETKTENGSEKAEGKETPNEQPKMEETDIKDVEMDDVSEGKVEPKLDADNDKSKCDETTEEKKVEEQKSEEPADIDESKTEIQEPEGKKEEITEANTEEESKTEEPKAEITEEMEPQNLETETKTEDAEQKEEDKPKLGTDEVTELKTEISEEKIEDVIEVKSEDVIEVKSEDVSKETSEKEIMSEEVAKVNVKTEVIDEKQQETDKDEETDIETDTKREEESKNVPQEPTESTSDILSKEGSEETKVSEDIKPLQRSECDTDVDMKPPEELENNIKQEEEVIEEKKDNDTTDVVVVKQENECKASVVESVKEEIQVEDSMHVNSMFLQNDEVMSQASFNLDMELGEPTVAQLLAITSGNVVRWPKDKVLQIRLEHVVQAVEKNEWPIIRTAFLPGFPGVGVATSTSPAAMASATPRTASPSPHRSSPAPSVTSREGHSREATPLATPEPPPLVRELILPDVPVPPLPDFGHSRKQSPIPSSSPMSTGSGDSVKHRRRRRRRRFEIEAERAKLRQLLSHNMQQQQQHHQQQMQQVQQFLATTNASLLRNKLWDDHSDDKLPLPIISPGNPSALMAPSLPTTSASSVPPPAHQNSSPRMSTTLGSLDLRVKSSVVTPPMSFNPLMQLSKSKLPVVENLSKAADVPLSPMDLSASSVAPPPPPSRGSAKQTVKTRLREGRGSRGGSRIDALALNLQARKQQQMMQEQHHGIPLDNLSSASDHSDKIKEASDHDEPLPSRSHSHHHHHSSHHHQSHHGLSEKRNLEEEETKLRKKRLQYSEDAIRKSLNRAFEMSSRAPPAHSSFLNSAMSSNLSSTSSVRMHLGSKPEEPHGSSSNLILDHSGLVHHDFKKWIEEHPELVATNPNLVAAAAAAMAFNPVPSFPSHTELLELPEGRRRGRRPRLDPSKLDMDKVTGEENVSVINRLTGKKITGSKAPPLKHLAEWLDKNPMFDVDPKWGSLVREKGNLPNAMMGRIVTPSEKRGRRTAASLLASAHQNLVTPPSTMSFPSASSLNPLSFTNPGMLTGFPNMNFFKDPPKVTSTLTPSSTTSSTSTSNPPIFLPFGGLAGMGLTNPLFGFPGFNFPGLQGTSSLGSSLSMSKDQGKDIERKPEKSAEGGSSSSISSSRKSNPISTSASSIISSSTMPSATSLPFLYPAPGLLYNPLGLGSFALPPNLPASFASFTQSGLVNGLGLNSPLITTSPMSTTTTTSLVSSAITSTIPSASSHTTLSSSLISPKGGGHGSSKHSPSRSSLHETQDTDEESLKSLMGIHEDEDDEDMEDGKTEGYDNLEKDDSDRDNFRNSSRKSPIFGAGRSSAKMSESESEAAGTSKSTRAVAAAAAGTEGRSSNKSKKVISDDPTSDSTDTESKAS